MGNITASVIISFAEKLEDHSAAFYKDLAEKFPQEAEVFLSLAKGCEKTKTLVIQTYRETVSDALETGFSFEGLDLTDYEAEVTNLDDVDYREALKRAIELEGKAADFYQDVAKRSRSLLATISVAFKSASKRRIKHKQKLESLNN
jgi:rubrerythrin